MHSVLCGIDSQSIFLIRNLCVLFSTGQKLWQAMTNSSKLKTMCSFSFPTHLVYRVRILMCFCIREKKHDQASD